MKFNVARHFCLKLGILGRNEIVYVTSWVFCVGDIQFL